MRFETLDNTIWGPQGRCKLLIIRLIRMDLALIYHDISTLGWVSRSKHYDWGATWAALAIRHDNGKFSGFRPGSLLIENKDIRRNGLATANLDCQLVFPQLDVFDNSLSIYEVIGSFIACCSTCVLWTNVRGCLDTQQTWLTQQCWCL